MFYMSLRRWMLYISLWKWSRSYSMWRASVVWPKPFTLGWADRLKCSLCPYSEVLQNLESERSLVTVLKDSVGCDAGELRSKWAVDAISHTMCVMQAWGKGVSGQHLPPESLWCLYTEQKFLLNTDTVELGANLNKSGFYSHLHILIAEGLVS